MAFVATDLSVLAYANNFTLWHYVTTDDAVTAGSYFDKAVDMLRVGDMIVANVDTDGETPVNKIYVVTANDGSGVTVTVYS